MSVQQVAQIIETSRTCPVTSWPSYRFEAIPFAVYDAEQVVYIGHPNPPDTRPETLAGATSVEINGVLTALIPVDQCPDETAAAPLAYHEGFHVFQRQAFRDLGADMFTAMAFYPELDPIYRTWSRLEIEVLNREDWTTPKKLEHLGWLARQRHGCLSHHESLIPYARFLERSEGTAFYVEQKARQVIYGMPPGKLEFGHGWSRYYQVGAAICWLLDEEALPGWTTRVEDGESLSDLVQVWAGSEVNLDALDYEAIRQSERLACHDLCSQLHREMSKVYCAGLRIRYPPGQQVFRVFNPQTLISLGDGRVLHRSFFQLIVPTIGKIAVTDALVIDNLERHELMLNAVPVRYEDGCLTIQTDQVACSLSHVIELKAGCYEIVRSN